MLRNALCNNIFIIFILSIFFMIRVFNKGSDLKKLRKSSILFLLLNFINFYLCGLVEMSWNWLLLAPISFINFIILILSIYFASKKIKESSSTDCTDTMKKVYSILAIIPIVVFTIPYLYELYIINNCSYLLKYNSENAILTSDDTYIAIINDKPVEVTLLKNPFNRKGISTEAENYDITYNNGIEISTSDSNYDKISVENEHIKKIALDAKKMQPSTKSASVRYFPEGNYSIISCSSEESYKEYFYYNTTYITEVHTEIYLLSVTFYE